MPKKDRQGRLLEHQAVHLWYYLRALDSAGSGRVDFDLQQAAKVLRVSIQTIRRWVFFGLKNGLFRSALLKGPAGSKRIFLSSAIKVARRLGASDFGICFELEVGRLHELSQTTSEAVAHHLQRSSSFAAKKESTSRGKIPVFSQDILRGKRARGIVARGDRFTYLDGDLLPIGGSQEQIANFQGRHRSTVQRRLSNSRRAARGEPEIDRTQLAQARMHMGATMRISVPEELEGKFFRPSWSRSTVFEALPNVYDFSYQTLVSKRCLRRKLKRAIAREELISLADGQKTGTPGNPTISTTDQSTLSGKPSNNCSDTTLRT